MTTQPCARCGHPHLTRFGTPACAGHISTGERAGQPCAKAPINGGTVCGSHGGRAPNVRAAATARLAEAEAARQVVTLGLPIDISPTEALLQEVQWTAGHVHWLRGKVQQLERGAVTTGHGSSDAATNHPLVWGTTKVLDKDSGAEPGTDTTQSAAPSLWYELYERERKHLVLVCTAALKAGVEERRVRLAEAQGDLVATAIRRILDALTLTTEQQALVATVVPRELRLIAGGTP